MPECTTHVVEANNEDEAIEKLIAWAFAHKSSVDEPMDFEVEVLEEETLAERVQTFMFCTYDDPAEYITEEWLSHRENIKILVTLLRLSIADDLKMLAHGIPDEQEAYGTDINTEQIGRAHV